MLASRAKLVILLVIVLTAVIPAGSGASWMVTSQPLVKGRLAVQTTAPPTSPASFTNAAPSSNLAAPDPSNFIKAWETEHFTFYVEPDSSVLLNISDFATTAESLLKEMDGMLGERLDQKIYYYLHSSKDGYFSALSFPGTSIISQRLDVKSSASRSKAVTAHELVHQITFQLWGYPESLVHLEGIAHWASESYWISAEGRSFDDRVRRYLASARVIPLADLLRDRSLWTGKTQTIAYDEAGSFVGYLIRTYGLERFKQVYLDPNYKEVYGKGLTEIENDWLFSLRGY